MIVVELKLEGGYHTQPIVLDRFVVPEDGSSQNWSWRNDTTAVTNKTLITGWSCCVLTTALEEDEEEMPGLVRLD